MSIRKKVILLLLVFLTINFVVYCEGIALNPKLQGNLYFIEENYEKAYEIMMKEEKNYREDVDYQYIMGRCAEELDQEGEAVKYFERVLNLDKNAVDARIRLTKIYLTDQGKYGSKGRKSLEELKLILPEEDVEELLSGIDAEKTEVTTKNWLVSTDAAFIFSDNVNNGTDEDTIDGVAVADEDKKTSDMGLEMNAMGFYQYSLNENLRFVPLFALHIENYFDLSEESTSRYTFGVESNIEFEGKSYSIPVIYSVLNRDGEKEETTTGLALSIKEYDLLNLSITPMIEYYMKKNELGDYTMNLTGISLFTNFGDVDFSVKIMNELGDIDYLENMASGISLNYKRDFYDVYNGRFGYAFEMTNYNEKESGQTEERSDTNHVFNAKVDRKLNIEAVGEFNIFGQYSLEMNSSNIAYYEYSKNTIKVGVGKDF